MTRLFLLLYLGVLVVLFAAWYIYGQVSERRRQADRARVVREAHAGGARLVARELDAAGPAQRAETLKALNRRFDYLIGLIPIDELPTHLQRRFASGVDVSYFQPQSGGEVVVASLANGDEVVSLGPFPNYGIKAIEDSLAGWIRLTVDKLKAVPAEERGAYLQELRSQFDIPVDIVASEQLPAWAQERVAEGADVVFYSLGTARSFAVSPLFNHQEFLRFGPFPEWEDVEQRAATTTLALVLLPTALAIALLLRPVARQLRRIEHAAEAIAAGALSTRVDERRTGSAQPLAHAFNRMASRTETLVRTQRELLQAVSHELRTPLSRMRFAIDLVETAASDTERRERLHAIDVAAEELDELVGELLRYVRMESAEPALEFEVIEVRDTLETIIPKYKETHPHLAFQIIQDGDQNLTIVADRQGFMRVLGNLLSNAARFAHQNVTITASATESMTVLNIDDDGSGIPETDRERVFEPFVRLQGKPSTKGDGFGLGLALVRRIVSQHGGTVEVLTSPLGGCRIRTGWPTQRVAAT